MNPEVHGFASSSVESFSVNGVSNWPFEKTKSKSWSYSSGRVSLSTSRRARCVFVYVHSTVSPGSRLIVPTRPTTVDAVPLSSPSSQTRIVPSWRFVKVQSIVVPATVVTVTDSSSSTPSTVQAMSVRFQPSGRISAIVTSVPGSYWKAELVWPSLSEIGAPLTVKSKTSDDPSGRVCFVTVTNDVSFVNAQFTVSPATVEIVTDPASRSSAVGATS